MSVDKIIEVFTTNYVIIVLNIILFPCQFDFNCKICVWFYNSLIHFNVPKSKIESSDSYIVLFFKEEMASSNIKQSNQSQTSVSGIALTSNLKDKHSTGCTVSFI